MPQTIAEAMEAVEAAYEFMLAYAAQGREREEDDPMGIRDYLNRAAAGLKVVAAATPADMGAPAGPIADATQAMLDVLKQDAARAGAAINFVLAQRSIGSQIIDNLNASIHIRALLTDVFLIDETLNDTGGGLDV
ncbi:MAG: hypothetical protein AB7F96_09455 [Beijerinckiaceae bacterium]